MQSLPLACNTKVFPIHAVTMSKQGAPAGCPSPVPAAAAQPPADDLLLQQLLENQQALEQDEEALEREALGKVVLAFRRYQADADLEVDRWEHNFSQLAPHQQLLLAPQKRKYMTARQCIHNNQFFLTSMLSMFDPDPEDEGVAPSMLMSANAAADEIMASGRPAVSPGDTEKVRYVLKNLVRDWSEEGAAERAVSYGRIITELRRLFGDWTADGKNDGSPLPAAATQGHHPTCPDGQPIRPRVLCPGAGLARLCCEIAGAGFEVQGNEFAYFMLLTSSFILNAVSEAEQYTIFPWVTVSCNVVDDSDQLRGVPIPDVCPVDIVSRARVPGLLSMAAGDFVEVYSRPDQKGAWDAVVTCFFIDTAHNVLQYLEVLVHCLRPGGYWINLGPLLYHWADGYGTSEMSIELSMSEIQRMAKALGFNMLQEEVVNAPYIANIRSMFKTVYQARFFTMQKVRDPVIPLPPPGLAAYNVPGGGQPATAPNQPAASSAALTAHHHSQGLGGASNGQGAGRGVGQSRETAGEKQPQAAGNGARKGKHKGKHK